MEKQKMKLVTYGLGNELDISKIRPIINDKFVKPQGGLWSSPINSNYGWVDWCKDENFGECETSFEFEIDANVLIINSLDDLKQLPMIKYKYGNYLDFEEIIQQGYDAIFLTERGQQNTRMSTPNLYGWDCECVLVLNPNCIVH